MKKYENYVSTLNVLSRAGEQDLSNEFIVSGIIDKFIVQFELGWKLLKELLAYEGRPITATGSPRSIIKTAYQVYDFIDEEMWLEMLKARNDLTHIYNAAAARELTDHILNRYLSAFEKMKQGLISYYGEELLRG